MSLKMPKNTFDILDRIVDETKCKPGWFFSLVDEDGVKRLVITIEVVNNYAQSYTVSHYHPVPITIYNEKSWRRWILDQCIRTMNHEIGECLTPCMRSGPR